MNEDTIWTLCYTSGTTGNPKGVIITHKGFLSMMTALVYGSFKLIPKEERILSYLPLAHVAERLMYFTSFYFGGKIGIFTSSNKKDLPKALKIVKPTIFLSVPRLYNKFYAVFNAKIAALGCCKSCLVSRGLKTK